MVQIHLVLKKEPQLVASKFFDLESQDKFRVGHDVVSLHVIVMCLHQDV